MLRKKQEEDLGEQISFRRQSRRRNESSKTTTKNAVYISLQVEKVSHGGERWNT